jgi:uncharacterized membrane protein
MSHQALAMLHNVIEWAALGIELLAVALIVSAVFILAISRGTVRYLFRLGEPGAYDSYKHQLGKVLLLGLELLVAADVVRTVALEPTLNNVAILGLLVVVRTFLSWSMSVEIEGHWPWQPTEDRAAAPKVCSFCIAERGAVAGVDGEKLLRPRTESEKP